MEVKCPLTEILLTIWLFAGISFANETYPQSDVSLDYIMPQDGNSDPVTSTQKSNPEEITDDSSLIGVSRYIGIGYHIFHGNPFATKLDSGLKKNSFQPVKILEMFSRPNSSCPELVECFISQEPETVLDTIYIRGVEDYQKAIRDQLQINGRVTGNISAAFGLLDNSITAMNHILATGQYFVDQIKLSVTKEASLSFRQSQSLHPNFVAALCELPQTYNFGVYGSFLAEFGTHVVVKVREAVISINRTFIDAQSLRRAAEQVGKNITFVRDETQGFNPSDISNSVLARALAIMKNSEKSGKKTSNFSSIIELPIVTGLTEISYFINREKILFNENQFFSNCLNGIDQEASTNGEIDDHLETIRKNIEKALIDLANKTLKEFPTGHQRPDFIPWNQRPDFISSNSSIETISENPKTILKSNNQTLVTPIGCAAASAFIGLGYDIFRGDLYSSLLDPGIHTSPALLTNSICSSNSSKCSEAVQCSTVTPFTVTRENLYVWTSEDFTKQIRKTYGILHSVPKIITDQLSADSSSTNVVRRLVSDGQTFIDAITANISTEASSNYRSMDQLDPNYVHAICELPLTYNKTAYIHLLREFGTHIIVKVRVGNLTVARTIIPQATVLREAFKNAQNDGLTLPVETETPTTSEVHQFSAFHIQTAADLVVRKAKNFKRTGIPTVSVVEKTESPVSWTLREVWYFITKERIAKARLGNTCQHLLGKNAAVIENIKSGLSRALVEYAVEVAANYEVVTTQSPTIPPQIEPDRSKIWPRGTFGLLEASSGCPNGPSWRRGIRYHDSEDYNNRNEWHRELSQLTASGLSREGIRLNFCVKTESIPDEEPDWPQGSYCIFEKGSCPSGFKSSYVDYDDEDNRNTNLATGTLPDGFYGHNTRYYFCCRSDGDSNSAIQLPTEKPFFLLNEDMNCQLVAGMHVTPLWLFTDCEDNLGGCQMSKGLEDLHPGLVNDYGDWQWHFCYYKPVTPLFELLFPDSTNNNLRGLLYYY